MKRNDRKTERGQALILITFAIIGLIAMTGLTVDGGLAYSDRRSAQNAADSAAFSASLAHSRGQNINSIAMAVASTNGYDNNGTTNIVTVSIEDSPSGACPPRSDNNKDITVEITSVIRTSFSTIVGIQDVTNKVVATTRACGTYIAPLFDGNAIVGLNPSTSSCAFDSDTGNATWRLEGGGIFSNGCAVAKNNVTFDPEDLCTTAVGSASGFSCEQPNQSSLKINYPQDVAEIMPDNPCDGSPGDVGIPVNYARKQDVPNPVTFSNGVYCISNFDVFDAKDIVLDNATLYVTDTNFDLRFAGGGGFSGTPSQSGDFAGYYLVIGMSSPPCPSYTSQNSQVIVFRGNGLGDLYGTILAPSACIDFRGNPNGSAVHSQIIGYNVSANGTATNYIQYVEEENRREPKPITIELLR
jgi:Flp pilus assembly protein TadG